MSDTACPNDTPCTMCHHPMASHWTVHFGCSECKCGKWTCPNPHTT